jgi:hypothetical protein
VRVFGRHLGAYTQSSGDLPTQFATESMFRDELSGTSCFGSFSLFSSFDAMCNSEEFFTLCDTLISGNALKWQHLPRISAPR